MHLLQVLLLISQSAKVLYESRNYEILSDSMIVKDVYKEILIIDKTAASKYGFEEINYDEELDSVVISKAYTLTKKNEIFEVTSNAINIVIPEEIEDYPEYSNLKKIVVSFLNIEDSSKLIIHYKIFSKYRYVYEKIKISKFIPVDKMIVIINPNGNDIKYRSSSDVKTRKKANLIIFEADSIPSLVEEPFLPAFELYGSFIEFTNLDWKNFYDFLKGLLTDEDNINVSVNEIYNLKKTDIDDSFLKFRLRKNSGILNSGRGTYLERLKLLYFFLKDSFYISVVYDPFTFNPDFPSFDFVDIILYNENGYISPDFKKCSEIPFDLNGNIFVFFNNDTFQIEKKGEFSKRIINEKIDYNLKNTIVYCEILLDSVSGEKLKERFEHKKEELIDELSNYFSVSKISFDKEKNILRIKGKKDFFSQDSFYLILIEPINLKVFSFPDYSFYKKKYPFYISEGFIFNFVQRLVNINGEIIYPEDISIDNRLFSYSERYETDKNEIKIHINIKYEKGCLEKEFLDEFREFNQKTVNKNKFIIIKE